MILRSKITAISFIFIATMLLLIVSCKNPSNSVSDGGLQIDASDPLDVLRALPTELNRPDSMIARFASSGSRAATVPTANSEVFHPDAVICPPDAKQKMDTASLALSIVQILKKMESNPFEVDIAVDSGDVVSLGSLLMEASIMKPLNSNPDNLYVDYHGILIDTISSDDSPNGVSGFAYYLPFTFQHEDGPYELYNYFEFFFEDTENMVLTAATYVYIESFYYKYHTTILTIDDGNQIIERYENQASQGVTADDDYTYEYFSYDIQTDTTQAYIISRGTGEGFFAVTADQYGGMAITIRDEGSSQFGKREAFSEDYNLMARFSDSDSLITDTLPSDFSTPFSPIYSEYSYRYLDDNVADTTGLITTVPITFDDDHNPESQIDAYVIPDSDPYEGVVDDLNDPFLLGSTNTGILEYVTEKIDLYYLDIYDTLEANLDPAVDPQETPGWLRMHTENLGVDDPDALETVFDTIQAL